MLNIDYIEESEISISAASDSLKKFADQIREISSEFSFPVVGNESVSKILVRQSSSKILAQVDGSNLVISGNSICLENLSDNIPWDAEDPENGVEYHIHYDRATATEFLDSNSPDLVFTKNRQ